MVRIRLTRLGRKHLPHYRIVVSPLREKRDSKFVEELGHYSPLTKVVEINKERAEYWISVGAQPSETVKALLVKKNILKADKYKRTFKKKPGKKATERAKSAE
jgi:small subunit ribosomal protein S16